MYKTATATISMLITQKPLLVLFFEYSVNSHTQERTAVAFNLDKRGDIAQMNQLCKYSSTTFGNFFELDHKSLRLIVDNDDTACVKGIGHADNDSFFLTNGLGETMTKAEAYKKLGMA